MSEKLNFLNETEMKTKLLFGGILLFASFIFGACCHDPDDDTIVPPEPKTEIPDDSQAGTPPTDLVGNLQIPNATYSLSTDNSKIVLMNMSGIYNPIAKEWMTLVGSTLPGQNVWLSLDDVNKGIFVINNKPGVNDKIKMDVVFLVDNSGSMGEESDKIASEIITWAQYLGTKNVDAKFGTVGYYGPVSGAVNLTDVATLDKYLNRSGYGGTGRTMGFYGADSAFLASKSAEAFYNKAYGECGVVALRFANDIFAWRPQSNRVYINFTDEPNQPNESSDFSVEFVKDQKNWNTLQGTIHSVFSQDTTYMSNERPWLLSDYTGGTKLFIKSDASDLSLMNMPVTGAIANSYVIKFINSSNTPDGSHKVIITVRNPDGTVGARREFTNVWFTTPTKYFNKRR